MHPVLEKYKMKKKMMGRIDDKLINLIENGTIPDTESEFLSEEFGKIRAMFAVEYWRLFTPHLDEEEILFILSLPQPGNWNRYLYKAAQERKIELFNEIAEQVLLNE